MTTPDGKFLAYALQKNGKYSLWVRQIATGSDIPILPQQAEYAGRMRFGPDGSYLYYGAGDPQNRGYNALYRVPTLGGLPRKILYDVDSPVTFSPDGRQLAFIRNVPLSQERHLMIASADGSSERKLAAKREQVIALSWSPDGARVFFTSNRKGAFDLSDLREQLMQMQQMGGMAGLMGMLPGVAKMKNQLASANLDERLLKRQVAIIDSMTPRERKSPDVLKASRKKRIAAGSGTKVEDVNRMLKMHRNMADVMKAMGSRKRGPMAGLANMLGLGGGMPSPEQMQQLAERMPGGMPGLPQGAPGVPGLPPTMPGLAPKLPSGPLLPGLGGKPPGLGGFPGFGKKK
jgi:hypothetical protein